VAVIVVLGQRRRFVDKRHVCTLPAAGRKHGCR
jgi:hypothetical protein